MIHNHVETEVVERCSMPTVKVKLYLSRFEALQDLGDDYISVHQDHSDGATSNIIDDRILVALIDLDILKSNNCDNEDSKSDKHNVINNESMASFLGLITHEAYHLACRWMETLGEDNPGEEELAYHVEAISSSLFEQLLDYFDNTC